MKRPIYERLKRDSRVYTQLDLLYGIKRLVSGSSRFPEFAKTSNLSGTHLSTQRGRGLNFEELRHYQQGDEVRHMDWKVTMRTGKPHIRAYSEEREQNFIVCVDQRESMFFSSLDTMKSVAAANIAAYCMWQVASKGDRIGAVIMDDQQSTFFPSFKGARHTEGMMRALQASNHQLGGEHSQIKSEDSFHELLRCVQNNHIHNSTIIIISDWYGLSADSTRLLRFLQKSNHVIGVQVVDPVESDIDHWQGVNISDGKHQIQLSDDAMKHSDVLQQYSETMAQQSAELSKLLTTTDFPLISISTDGGEIAAFSRHFL